MFLHSVRGDLYWDPCPFSVEESGCKGSFDVEQIERAVIQPRTGFYETGPIGDSRSDPKNIRIVTVYPQTQEFTVERY